MDERRKPYPFDQFEPKWQAIWEEQQLFHAPNPGEKGFDSSKSKFYVLDMFPYPSGAGLHVGHPEGYTATDIVSRFLRMQGVNVLHPMGWDAFGLPAEQYAVKTNQHPRVTTQNNVNKFREQIQSLGLSYDWDREVDTTDPHYYKWTQWIFLQLFNSYFDPTECKAKPIEHLAEQLRRSGLPLRDQQAEIDRRRLAYMDEVPVNWCPALGTVLANEEVIDGKSEVGGFPVERRPMRQWMLRITAYADRLVNDLEMLEWPESLKEMQRNWIGRSVGAEVDFEIVPPSEDVRRVEANRGDNLSGSAV